MNNYKSGVEVRDVQDYPKEFSRLFLISTTEELKKGNMFKVDGRAYIAIKVTKQEGTPVKRLWIKVKLPQS